MSQSKINKRPSLGRQVEELRIENSLLAQAILDCTNNIQILYDQFRKIVENQCQTTSKI